MRLAFLGTPEAAVTCLRALVEAGHDVALVVTRPDRRRGRGGQLSPSPVKAAALALGLPVTHRLDDVADAHVERGVVVAFGRIIPEELLARVPMLNVHFSLLPRWRGAAPVQRAILAGDEETGVTIMTLEATLDTGPVHAVRRVEVADKSAEALTAELAALGAEALVEVLARPALLEHSSPQRGEATYADKITKEELHLRATMSVAAFTRTVRVGGAFALVAGRRLGVLSAGPATLAPPPGYARRRGAEVAFGVADGGVALLEVRPEGARAMAASAWWSGLRGESEEIRWDEGTF